MELVTNPEMMMIVTLILSMRGIAFMAVGS